MAIFDKIKGAYLKNKKKRKAYSEYLDRLEKAQGGDKQAQFQLERKQVESTKDRFKDKIKQDRVKRSDTRKAKKTYKSSMPSVDKPVTPEYYKAKEGLSKAEKTSSEAEEARRGALDVHQTSYSAFRKKYPNVKKGQRLLPNPKKAPKYGNKIEPQRGMFEGVEERNAKGDWVKKPEVKIAPKKKKKKRSFNLKSYGKRFMDYQNKREKNPLLSLGR